jgi:hypothetical protein
MKASSGWIFMVFGLPESCMGQYNRLAFASRPFSSKLCLSTLQPTELTAILYCQLFDVTVMR